MEIFLPEDLKPFEPDLRFFFDMMILKLRLNKSKGFGEGKTPMHQFNLADAELTELRDALMRGTQEDVLAEAADVANMAWLTALSAIRMDKLDFTRQPCRSVQKHADQRVPEATLGPDDVDTSPSNCGRGTSLGWDPTDNPTPNKKGT